MRQPKEPTKVPEPRQARHRPSATSRVFLWTFLLLVLGLAASAAAGFLAYQQYMAAGPLAEKRVFIVEPGLNTPEIGEALEEAGIISNAVLFSAMAHVTGTRTRLKAGEYEFAEGVSMQNVMALIASGKSITYKLSIPEGFTSEMAVARVNAKPILAGPPAAVPPEGSIMADTYVFRRGMTRQKLVEDMQAAQTRLLGELWDTRIPIPVVETPAQAVTLASIVEKETGVAAERPVIASVFINRLRKGMRLQSDPTIIYGIAGGKGKLDRSLTRSDIEAETPYNTYRIDGLPPGPIANPGRAALEAVLRPQPTDYLYFVADGSGGHTFATTLDEHNRNVRKWRQISGNAAAAAAADAPAAGETPGAAAPQPATVTEDSEAAAPAAPQTPPAPTPPSLALEAAVPPPESPPAVAEASPGASPPDEGPQAAAPTVAPSAPDESEPTQTGSLQTVEGGLPAVPPDSAAPRPKLKPVSAPKPGSVVEVEGRLVAVPRQKPER